ncbi:MAG: hypothetical protein SGARI_002726 [Bacillariaceae sp.]
MVFEAANIVKHGLKKSELQQQLHVFSLEYRKKQEELKKEQKTLSEVHEENAKDYFGDLHKNFDDCTDGTGKGTLAYWRKHCPDCTMFEAILLEWACMTGEMWNLQDLRCHLDRNNAHVLETMLTMGILSPKDFDNLSY